MPNKPLYSLAEEFVFSPVFQNKSETETALAMEQAGYITKIVMKMLNLDGARNIACNFHTVSFTRNALYLSPITKMIAQDGLALQRFLHDIKRCRKENHNDEILITQENGGIAFSFEEKPFRDALLEIATRRKILNHLVHIFERHDALYERRNFSGKFLHS